MDAMFTVSRVDNTPNNHRRIEDTVSSGMEIFGSTQTAHP
jgi:hypothetical protein